MDVVRPRRWRWRVAAWACAVHCENRFGIKVRVRRQRAFACSKPSAPSEPIPYLNAHRLLLLCAATTWRATPARRVKPPAGSACLPWMCCRWLAAQVPCSRRLLTSVEHEQPRVRSASPRGHDAPSMVLECARDVLSWPLIRSLLCMVVLLCAGYRSIERYTACRISQSHTSTGPTCIYDSHLCYSCE